MSIKTNHSTESLAPTSGVLKIDAAGALALPAGDNAQRPSVSAAGYLRFASDLDNPEYYDGTSWQLLTSKSYVDSAVSNVTLENLADVATTAPSDGQVIAYDSTLGQFRAQTQALTVLTKFFMGDGVKMDFDIATQVSSVQNLVVSINGIQQEPFYSYSLVDGHIVLFDGVPEDGDRIHVKILRSSSTTDRPRPRVMSVSYSTIAQYTTITIVASDITLGTGVKIGDTSVTRIDYPNSETMQVMIETARITQSQLNNPQNLTLVDVSGNEFVFEHLINFGQSKPYWTNSTSYIGTFSSGDTINFPLGVNNASSLTIDPAYAGEAAISWLSISGTTLVGTAPNNSSPSRFEVQISASNGSAIVTKNYWLLVI